MVCNTYRFIISKYIFGQLNFLFQFIITRSEFLNTLIQMPKPTLKKILIPTLPNVHFTFANFLDQNIFICTT